MLEKALEERLVLARIDAVLPAGEHRDRAALERSEMGLGVDAAREPRYDDEARLAEVAGEPFGEAQAERRSNARADDRDHRAAQHGKAAAHPDQRRRVRSGCERLRIGILPERDEGHAELRRHGELGPCLLDVAHMQAAPLLAMQARQGRERGGHPAIAMHQAAESARADALGADQAQPVEPLGLAERKARAGLAHVFDPIRLSLPARSRLMFCACFAQSKAAISPKTRPARKSPKAMSMTTPATLPHNAASEE